MKKIRGGGALAAVLLFQPRFLRLKKVVSYRTAATTILWTMRDQVGAGKVDVRRYMWAALPTRVCS